MPVKEAIILAGGLGKRLRSVVKEIPKPMAPVNHLPFLKYLLHYLGQFNVNRVVLSVGYKHEVIKAYFGTTYKGIELVYVVEEEPLGTGGGIKLALSQTRDESVFLLNGDTFFAVDLDALANQFLVSGAQLCLSLKEMKNFDRYGVVSYQGNKISGFKDKAYCAQGWINGGVYALKTQIFEALNLPEKFSFEVDFMEKYVDKLTFSAFLSRNYFIDIGIPEDYEQVQHDFKNMEQFKTLVRDE